MKKTLKNAVLIGFAFAQAAMAGDAKYVASLKASDGTKIETSFEEREAFSPDWGGCGKRSAAYTRWADGIRIRISSEYLAAHSGAQVSAVIQSRYVPDSCRSDEKNAVGKIEFERQSDGTYLNVYGISPLQIFMQDLQGNEHVLGQKLAVVVDGDWKTDPMNGLHDFSLSLDQAFQSQSN